MADDLAYRLRRWAADEARSTALVEAADHIDKLEAEVAAFREAVKSGEAPSCEDVCLRSCVGIGVCRA